MPINRGHPAWRTSPCKFYLTNKYCSKGSECAFAHLDDEGNDVHKDAFEPQDKNVGPSSEGDDTASFEEAFEEDQSEEVGEAAEATEEEEDLGIQPHFGIFDGSGP